MRKLLDVEARYSASRSAVLPWPLSPETTTTRASRDTDTRARLRNDETVSEATVSGRPPVIDQMRMGMTTAR